MQGRKRALADSKTVENLAEEGEGRNVADSSFDEFSPALRSTSWPVRAMGRFFHSEAIHLLEGRAQIRGPLVARSGTV